jgi:hypothetical protein
MVKSAVAGIGNTDTLQIQTLGHTAALAYFLSRMLNPSEPYTFCRSPPLECFSRSLRLSPSLVS